MPPSHDQGASTTVNVVTILEDPPLSTADTVECTANVISMVGQQEIRCDHDELNIKAEKRLSLSDIVPTEPINDDSQQMLTIVSDDYRQAIVGSAEHLQQTDANLKIVPNIEIEYITCSSVIDEKLTAERYEIHFNEPHSNGTPNTFTVSEWPPQQDYDDDGNMTADCYTTEEFQNYTMEEEIKDDDPIYETEVCDDEATFFF